jgi:hypothetical protein
MQGKGGKEMKRIFSITILILIVVTGLVTFPEKKVFACSCVGGDAKERLERSTAVFVGKVIDRSGIKSFQHGQLRKYTFDVDTAWKGVNDNRMTIYSYDGSEASCGFQFDKGQSYLVYSYKDKDNSMQTNLCSGNVLSSQAGEELKQLGTGTMINKNEGEETNNDRNSSFSFKLFSTVILIIVITILFIWRINKRNRFS